MDDTESRPDGHEAPTARARRPRGSGDRRREILEAALQLFTEAGYERATLNDIVERAGVSKGALYHYFASKEQVLLELMRDRLAPHIAAAEEIVTSADPSLPVDVVLRQLIGRSWELLRNPQMMALAYLAVTELPKHPEVGRLFFDVVATARAPMRRTLERSPHLGRGDARAGTLANIVQSMIFGAALTRHVFAGIDPDDLDADRFGEMVTEVLLHGALRAPDASVG